MFKDFDRYQNYIFDLDGTLVNSSDEVMLCFKSACDNLGADINPKTYNTDVIGPPLEEIFRTIIVDNSNDKLIKALVVEFNRIYDFDENDQSPMYENAYDWLTSLKKSGKRLFMATNKFLNPTVRLMKKFNFDMFEDVYTIDKMAGRYISKQEMIESIIEKYGLEKSQTVMVGDTPGDVKSAHKAGIKAIGVLWGYGSDKTVLNEISDFIMELKDLKELVKVP